MKTAHPHNTAHTSVVMMRAPRQQNQTDFHKRRFVLCRLTLAFQP
jgi:hypothetical protein